ncbi:DNA primase [Deltaproteobacteria bacterium TL4]
MKYSSSFINKVKESNNLYDLVQEKGIHLKRSGSDSYTGLCPFHSEKTGSFQISPQKGFFHCFGCKISGDAIKFLELYEHLSFVESVEELAKRAGIPLEEASNAPKAIFQKPGFQCLKEAARFYHAYLMRQTQAEDAPGYLKKRNISPELCERFQLGYAPKEWQVLFNHLQQAKFSNKDLLSTGLVKQADHSDRLYDRFRNRIIFPIRDLRGRCIGFGGRVINPEDQPKYLNSPQTEFYNKSRVLYGFYEGLEVIRKRRHLIFVEGYFDVIRLHAFGFEQAVATCGTALTPEHLREIQHYADSITLLFDGDPAGQEAALKSCNLFLSNSLAALIVTLPDNEDPDSYLLKHGKEAFEQQLQKGLPFLEYLVQRILAKYPANVQGRNKALEEMLPMIKQIKQENIQQMTLVSLAEMLKLPISTLMKQADTLNSSPRYAATLTPTETTYEEVPEEKTILQALLNVRTLISLARNHLQASELWTPPFRKIYELFLLYSDGDFQGLKIEQFNQRHPEYQDLLMRIYMEPFFKENAESQFRAVLRRIKERNLKTQFQRKMENANEEERFVVQFELRKRLTELDALSPARH